MTEEEFEALREEKRARERIVIEAENHARTLRAEHGVFCQNALQAEWAFISKQQAKKDRTKPVVAVGDREYVLMRADERSVDTAVLRLRRVGEPNLRFHAKTVYVYANGKLEDIGGYDDNKFVHPCVWGLLERAQLRTACLTTEIEFHPYVALAAAEYLQKSV